MFQTNFDLIPRLFSDLDLPLISGNDSFKDIPFLFSANENIMPAWKEMHLQNNCGALLWPYSLFCNTRFFSAESFQEIYLSYSEVTIEKNMCEIPHNYKCHLSKS